MINRPTFRILSFLFLLSLFSGISSNAQTLEADDAIQKLLDENKIPALGLGVIKGGKLTEVKVFGELEKGETAPFDTIFNVASLTKPIVAMTALKLASAGKLDLDEPLDKYWIDP